jgi:uncharacterized protein (DUF433 family)
VGFDAESRGRGQELLGDGYNADDIVREYPELEREDVYQAAKYGAWLASEKNSVLA